MRGFRWALARFVIAIIFGLVTFWPNVGLVFTMTGLFPLHQIPVAVFACVWFAFLMLLLPLPLWMFSRTTVVLLAIIFGICAVSAAQARFVDPSTLQFWLTWGIGALFAIIGWLMVATPLWRLFHGVVAVQQTGEPEHHG